MNWRRAYVEMFARFRDQARELRRNSGIWISDQKLEARAWREAETACQRAIREHNEAIELRTH